jgi:hypothetical protein
MGTNRWPPLHHQHTCLCQWLTLTAQHGLRFPVDGASGGALARLARRVASTRSPLHIIPISANGPPQHSPPQPNPVGMLALTKKS